jgi:hypothetical protein
MKVFWVFLLLFTLTIGLLIAIDLSQGASWSDMMSDVIVSKTELTGEDYVLIFLFTVPFGLANLVLKFLNKQKKKRNQEQNQGQNTSK